MAILELGMDIIILNKRALIKKILALHEGTAWDFTRFPLLIDVDKNSPSICSEAKGRGNKSEFFILPFEETKS